MAPLPIPEPLRRARGFPDKRGPRRELRVELLTELPPAPEFLSSYGAEEWQELGRELIALKILSPLDVNVLAAYCASYGRWRSCQEALGNVGHNSDALLRISREAARDMMKFARELGQVGATRLTGDPAASAGKFSDLVGA